MNYSLWYYHFYFDNYKQQNKAIKYIKFYKEKYCLKYVLYLYCYLIKYIKFYFNILNFSNLNEIQNFQFKVDLHRSAYVFSFNTKGY